MTATYRSKPSTIEAVQWTGDNWSYLVAFAPTRLRLAQNVAGPAQVELLAGVDGAQGWVPVPVGHWVVSKPADRSDLWPVDRDYFAAKYELAEPSTTTNEGASA